jgi:hypothetical protein
MVLGAGPRADPAAGARAAGTATAVAPLVTGLIALAVLGTVAWPLGELLRAAGTIAGTP